MAAHSGIYQPCNDTARGSAGQTPGPDSTKMEVKVNTTLLVHSIIRSKQQPGVPAVTAAETSQ